MKRKKRIDSVVRRSSSVLTRVIDGYQSPPLGEGKRNGQKTAESEGDELMSGTGWLGRVGGLRLHGGRMDNNAAAAGDMQATIGKIFRTAQPKNQNLSKVSFLARNLFAFLSMVGHSGMN